MSDAGIQSLRLCTQLSFLFTLKSNTHDDYLNNNLLNPYHGWILGTQMCYMGRLLIYYPVVIYTKKSLCYTVNILSFNLLIRHLCSILPYYLNPKLHIRYFLQKFLHPTIKLLIVMQCDMNMKYSKLRTVNVKALTFFAEIKSIKVYMNVMFMHILLLNGSQNKFTYS